MKVRTLGRMCILKHSILALERAPNMYRALSTSREPLPSVQELSASCIAYVSRLIWVGWVLWLTGSVVGLPHGKVGKGVGSHIFKSCIVKEENSGWLRLTDITK